jgi:hypothetical protein
MLKPRLQPMSGKRTKLKVFLFKRRLAISFTGHFTQRTLPLPMPTRRILTRPHRPWSRGDRWRAINARDVGANRPLETAAMIISVISLNTIVMRKHGIVFAKRIGGA